MNDARILSELLLDLYARCQQMPSDSFLPYALAQVRRRLPFDTVWWGLNVSGQGGRPIHGSYTEGLPVETPELWAAAHEDDVISRAMQAQPDCSLRFGPAEIDSSPGSRWLSRRMGHRHALCTRSLDPAFGQEAFLCLSRGAAGAAFTEADRRFKALLVPHIHAVLKLNHAAHLRQLRQLGPAPQAPVALADRRGALYQADDAFVARLQAAWPSWRGPLLPPQMDQHLQAGDNAWSVQGLQVEASWFGHLALLRLRPASRLAGLSPRERDTVEAFASGLSYKVVAQQLGMAPATVRHHLSNAYLKLGVDNKAAIAQLIVAERLGAAGSPPG